MKLNKLTEEKYFKLQDLIYNLESVVIGFSGGVDSTLVTKIATDLLGKNAIAVIGVSETLPKSEYLLAKNIGDEIKANIIEVNTFETDDLKFNSNPIDRCYFCKTELFEKLKLIAKEKNIKWIADGTIADDAFDYRPGTKAKKEQNVISPLFDVGINKNEVREIAKYLNLSNWDKPSSPCLSSRFPYGIEISKENLLKIEIAEDFLKELGFKIVRVRFHDDKTARIEIDKNEIENIFKNSTREKIILRFNEIGFIYVTIDLAGFRSGSMNEVLKFETNFII